MSRPWMPLYVRDYVADTAHLSTLEHGAYMLLIMHYWMHSSLPSDDQKLARIARLSPEQWSEIRPAIAEFFEPNWRHKRVEAELATTREKYQKRAEAGRRGGIASSRKRQGSNASAMLNQPQPHPHPHKGTLRVEAVASETTDEERFWSRLDLLEKLGISRSRCTQLLKIIGSDFIEANRVLDAAEAAKKPSQYLGAALRNLQQDSRATSPGAQPTCPDLGQR